MEIYYKLNSRGGARVTIADTMAEEAKEAQRAVAVAQGLLPVANVQPRPAATPFGIWHERLLPAADEYGYVMGYTQRWEFRPLPIRISQEKFLADETVAKALKKFLKALQADASLAAWWANDTSYVRGSETADLLVKALGLAAEEVEAAVIRSRR